MEQSNTCTLLIGLYLFMLKSRREEAANLSDKCSTTQTWSKIPKEASHYSSLKKRKYGWTAVLQTCASKSYAAYLIAVKLYQQQSWHNVNGLKKALTMKINSAAQQALQYSKLFLQNLNITCLLLLNVQRYILFQTCFLTI